MIPNPGLTIVLLGKTGVGKSASGNNILGRGAFESKLAFSSVTKEISTHSETVFGRQISVVDTPGILDSTKTDEIRALCHDLLQSSTPCLFLVVVRVGRFTDEDQKAVHAAMTVLGPRGMKKSFLLFTGGDILKDMVLYDFIFEEQSRGTLPDIVQMFAGAYHLFDNETDDTEQVKELLRKSGHLRIQDPPDSAADESNVRRIVLLGRPGSGKSSSGNTILGSRQFESDCDFGGVSSETVCKSAKVEGHQVTVVDTPGFTDEVLSPRQLFYEIMKLITEASPGPHAFIIVVKIGRISREDIKLFELLALLFKSDVLKYSMVLFTHGDELGGQSIEQKIQSNSAVSDLVSRCGGRYCVFDNKAKKRREQVRELLGKIDEMVTANEGQHFTNDMFRMVQTWKDWGLSREAIWNQIQRFLELVWEKIRNFFISLFNLLTNRRDANTDDQISLVENEQAQSEQT